jgi:hypothetical protein
VPHLTFFITSFCVQNNPPHPPPSTHRPHRLRSSALPHKTLPSAMPRPSSLHQPARPSPPHVFLCVCSVRSPAIFVPVPQCTTPVFHRTPLPLLLHTPVDARETTEPRPRHRTNLPRSRCDASSARHWSACHPSSQTLFPPTSGTGITPSTTALLLPVLLGAVVGLPRRTCDWGRRYPFRA